MLEHVPNVLIVDDNPGNIRVVDDTLQMMGCNTYIAFNGADAIVLAEKISMDVALLDVNMPGMDGYELCKKLKRNIASDIEVIFLSAMSSEYDVISGYDAGGDDYMTKPFNIKEIQAKIQKVIARRKQNDRLLEQVDNAGNAAIATLSSSMEMELVAGFMGESYRCKSVYQLASTIFDLLNKMNLMATIKFTVNEKNYFFRDVGGVSNLEEQVFSELKDSGSLCEFGCRVVLNSASSAFLIRNMPIDDVNRNDRLKSALGMLLKIVEHCVVSFESPNVEYPPTQTNEIISNIHSMQSSANTVVTSALDELVLAMRKELNVMGLAGNSGNSLLKLVEDKISEIKFLQIKGLEIEKFFNNTTLMTRDDGHVESGR